MYLFFLLPLLSRLTWSSLKFCRAIVPPFSARLGQGAILLRSLRLAKEMERGKEKRDERCEISHQGNKRICSKVNRILDTSFQIQSSSKIFFISALIIFKTVRFTTNVCSIYEREINVHSKLFLMTN